MTKRKYKQKENAPTIIATDLTAINPGTLSIEDSCFLELIAEASDRAHSEGGTYLTISHDRLQEIIAAKKR